MLKIKVEEFNIKNIFENSYNDKSCPLQSILPDCSRYDPRIASEINNTFKTRRRARCRKKSKLGYGYVRRICSYMHNDLVTFLDCSYFKPS